MVLTASNKLKRLLQVNYIGRVGAEELKAASEDMKLLLAELPADFRLLADLGCLESMDLDCAPELGRVMEMIDAHGVGMIVRVIPDPKKDIGMDILTSFHYAKRPRIVTCETMQEAARALGL